MQRLGWAAVAAVLALGAVQLAGAQEDAEPEAPAAPAVPAMQRWEYLHVITATWNNVVRPRYANGVEIEGFETLTMHEYMNQVGNDGWELISVAVTADASQGGLSYKTNSGRLVFKRPKVITPFKRSRVGR